MGAADTAGTFRLFRPEALEAQRQAGLGRVLINTPLAYWLMTCIVAALVATLLLLLGFAAYTPRIRAPGVLVASAPAAGAALEAQLLVPARAIAEIQPGLPVSLHFTVYPFAGLQVLGQVEQIDPVPVAKRIAHAAAHAHYRVWVRLPRFGGSGRPGARLTPGMRVRARIDLPRRRLLAWLVHGDAQPATSRVAALRRSVATP